jgi:hypothetical protein
MAKSRDRGQIIDRGNNSWLVKIFRGRGADGKRQYANYTVKGKRTDAQKFLTAKLHGKDSGVFVHTNKQNLNAFLDDWEKLVMVRVEEQTYDSYARLLRKHIRPAVGHLRLINIKTPDIQEVYTNMTSKGLSARTVRYVHSIISMALKKAVELNYLVRNVMVKKNKRQNSLSFFGF